MVRWPGTQVALHSLQRSSPLMINQARGVLLERALAVPPGKCCFAARLPEILEHADNGLPGTEGTSSHTSQNVLRERGMKKDRLATV